MDRPKAAGSWTPEQTVEYMFEKVLEEGDFYVICPDNDTPASLDKARMQWAADDVIQNRVPLSRWHPECRLSIGLANSRLCALRRVCDELAGTECPLEE